MRKLIRAAAAAPVMLIFSTLIGCATSPSSAPASSEDLYARDEATIEEWMNEWMSRDRAASGALHLLRFKDPTYVLLAPINWRPDDDSLNIEPVTVPKGFVTDLASVPRIFWSMFRPDGEYTYPAIVHDYLYWTQDRDRSEADDVFYLMMKEFDVNSAKLIYRAVDLRGGSAWSANRRLRENGERRFLKRFPQDPKITWSVYKNNEDIFVDQ